VTAPRFVIHKHDTSSLHYDFRLEVDGALKSWGVPKGPSTDPREKRLAIQVEDHRLDYGDFEGVIEDGYGKGTVLIWDAGSYRNLDEQRSMTEAVDAGHICVWLDGKKPTGGYTLQRMHHRSGASDGKPQGADQAPRPRSRRTPKPREHAAQVRQDRTHHRPDRCAGGAVSASPIRTFVRPADWPTVLIRAGAQLSSA
jgi:DNA ligase D-like protein (predicted 3'-phosphoesterase)